MVSFALFLLGFFSFLTKPNYFSLAVLELSMQTKLALNSGPSTSASLVLRLIKDVHHKACMVWRVPSPLYPWGVLG